MTSPFCAVLSLTIVVMVLAMTKTSIVTCETVTSFPESNQQTPDFRRVVQPRDPLPYFVVEELDASTPVGSVPIDAMLDRIYTEEQLKCFRYAIRSQTIAERSERVDLFTIDVTSGIVRTATRIDRDFLCHGRSLCIVLLDVIISPAEYFRIIRIAIDILDINDHTPDFGIAEVRLSIPESAVSGSSYALPVAVDRDSEQFGVVEYQLMGENVNSPMPFQLIYVSRYNELRLVVIGALDRELVDNYRLIVVSRDGGQPAGTGSIRLLVNVEDDNDNEPTFDRPIYDLEVVENSPPGTIVGRVHATDEDIGINGRVVYQLHTSTQSQQQDGSELNRFIIDQDNGVIYVGTTVDYERGAEYRLRVMAHDMASDLDDEIETGNDISTSGNVGEWTTDASVTGPAWPTMRIVRRPEYGGTNATRVSNGNDVSFAGSSDRLPDGSLTGYAIVRIRVVDRNDNAPRIIVNTFRSSSDEAVISESAAPGTFVAYVTVSDADTGSNGMVTCSVRNVSDNSVEADANSTFFRLEAMPSLPSTLQVVEYRLVTSSTLDRERNRRHVIGVVCRDHGEAGDISRESRVDVIVEVADVNDNAPRFERTAYDLDIVENNYVGDVIAVVKATDNDHGVNGQVRYQLEAGYEHLFNIDAERGAISTRVSFDREHLSSLTLHVIATDLGVPTALSSTATVHVNILDADDHAPTFDRRDYTFAVYENRPVGTDVGRVGAVDYDADSDNVDDVGGEFRYDLVPDQPLYDGGTDGYSPNGGHINDEFPLPFGINPTSGRIVTRSILDRERRSEYRLRVLAHATSGVFRSVTATARVVVHVLDVNDNRPRIHWPPPPPRSRDPGAASLTSDPVRVSAATPVGHVIAVVSAEDLDAGENGRLQYAVVGVNYVVYDDDDGGGGVDDGGSKLFGFVSPEEGRIIVLGSLADSLMITSSSVMLSRSFALTVSVSDCGFPRMTATSVLNIVVDGSLPFAHAHRTVALGSDKRSEAGGGHSTAVVVVMSCLSAMFVLLLIAVVYVLQRYLRDRLKYGSSSKDGAVSTTMDGRIGVKRGTNRMYARRQLLSCLKKRAFPFPVDVEVGIRGTIAKPVDVEQLERYRRQQGTTDDDALISDAENKIKKNFRPRLPDRPGSTVTVSCSNDSKYDTLGSCSERLFLTTVNDNKVVANSADERSPGVATYFRT